MFSHDHTEVRRLAKALILMLHQPPCSGTATGSKRERKEAPKYARKIDRDDA